MLEATHVHAHSLTAEQPVVRTIGIADLKRALGQGVQDFRTRPTHLVVLGLIYPVIMLIAARLTVAELLPLAFPLISGAALLGPLFAVGLYEFSRRREQGREIHWRDAFAVTGRPGFGSIVALGVLMAVIFGAWLIVAEALHAATLGDTRYETAGAFLDDVFGTTAGWTMIVVGNAIGLCFALVAFAIGVISFPMLVDRRISLGVAITTSVRAVLANPVTMILWGLIVVAMLLIGAVPLFAGLAVTIPILGHATWHLYRALVEP